MGQNNSAWIIRHHGPAESIYPAASGVQVGGGELTGPPPVEVSVRRPFWPPELVCSE
jgi:hypothetical protein